MKFKQLFIACLSVSLLTLASCKKEDKEETEKTTAEKIQARWGVDSTAVHFRIDGEDGSGTAPGESSDYFDFRSDGKLYMNLEAIEISDTLDYALQSDTKILIEGLGSYEIQNLTDNNLKLYTKITDPDSAEDFYELTFYLKK